MLVSLDKSASLIQLFDSCVYLVPDRARNIISSEPGIELQLIQVMPLKVNREVKDMFSGH